MLERSRKDVYRLKTTYPPSFNSNCFEIRGSLVFCYSLEMEVMEVTWSSKMLIETRMESTNVSPNSGVPLLQLKVVEMVQLLCHGHSMSELFLKVRF